jgi:hypothetical protein
MKIVPAGKYESALVHLVDELVSPDRNKTGHLYYMDLNRSVDRAFIDGVGTFAALSDNTVVPWELDWSDLNKRSGEERIEIGVQKSPRADRDDAESNNRYDQLKALGEQICEKSVLSERTVQYITNLDLTGYPDEVVKHFNEHRESSERTILSGYVRRFLDQVYTAAELKAYLLIREPDIQILEQIGSAIINGVLTTELPFPSLQNHLIDPEAFSHGVLNFSPKDVRALEHVRANAEVIQYGGRIQTLLNEAPAGSDDPSITDSLIDAYYRTKIGRQAKTVFEIGTWVVKPFHYVPVIGEMLTVAEDVKDLVQKAADAKTKQYEWWMIGVRMHQLGVEDYLNRLSNNRHPALRKYRDN